MAKLTVDSRIRVTGCGAAAEAALREAFRYPNPDHKAAAKLERAVRAQPSNKKLRGMYYAALKAPKEVATYAGDVGAELSLARGCLARAVELVEEHEPVELVDNQCDGDPRLGPVKGALKYELWDFQQRLLDAAVEGRQGMALSETGSGKTVCGFAIALAVKVPTLVLVHSSGLLKDWVRRAQDEMGVRAEDVGIIAGAEKKIRPLTIGMVQTLRNCAPRYSQVFGCVIADEIERFAARTLYAVGDAFPARYRIGIGAEFKRKDGMEFLTADLFGPELIRVTREEIGDKILDVEHRLFETGFAPLWYAQTPDNAKPYAFNNLVEAAMVSEERNRLLAQMAAREVRQGFPVLAFAHRREHVRLLEADLRRELPELGGDATGVMLGGAADEAEFERCTAGFRAGTLRFAGTTYAAASVGINLPALPVGMVATPCHMGKYLSRLRQTQGRLRRISAGKSDARLYVPWDRGCFGLAPLRASLKLAGSVKVLSASGEWEDGREVLRRESEKERDQRGEADSLDIFGGR